MSTYKELKANSGISGGNAAFIEALYEDYLADPVSVSEQWQRYFAQIKGDSEQEVSRLDVQERFELLGQQPLSASAEGTVSEKQIGVLNLIRAYRVRGHRYADTDPAKIRERHEVEQLSLSYHGLSDSDLQQSFAVDGVFGQQEMKLADLLKKLQKTYCGHVGLQFSHVWEQKELDWLTEQMEASAGDYQFSAEEKKNFLRQLVAADGMEKYLHKRYVGQKRFSLEGGDALIPLLNAMIKALAANGVEEVGIGMAHRGRLNVLINILGKKPQLLFDEFDGKLVPAANRSGDVKYHMGFSSFVEIDGQKVDLTLAYNPSHLEFVNAVTMGSTRARLERRRQELGAEASIFEVAHKATPILIHGDAALAGQGVNQEVLQLSQLRGYQVGGSLHVVVNNQIGFTTSNLLDARSSMYCTDIAKSVQAPIIHVNGDDPEAVVFAGQLAVAYLNTFQKDIFIDLVCYRRLGHNEADEPSATQPKKYEKIRAHDVPVDTSFDTERLKALGVQAFSVPDSFTPHAIVKRTLAARQEMATGKQPLDWGAAENLAYATLLDQGYQVRVSGEDCGRGTFSHRHAVLHDQNTGESYMPLQYLKPNQPSIRVIDSLLSETGVLGFEYGYSVAEPRGLIIWEAQFGDFANVAQVIIDQFIASGETKWGRYSGLVMLLPHGYEGQGPEHSSARLERYLQLSADENWQVCVPSTPAQVFHMLRRQVLRQFRKPLVVMSPKSLLRHKLAVSELQELAKGRFQEIIGEIDAIDAANVKRVIMCSGKVYYDLLQKRRDENIQDIAIVRVEQLYPFPEQALADVLAQYPVQAELVWCQEEPRNQGAWHQIFESLQTAVGNRGLTYCGRRASASTAAGYAKVHAQEQEALVNQALGLAN